MSAAHPVSTEKHGTPGSYARGCRCGMCRHNHAEASRKWRARRRKLTQADPDSVTHGLASSYTNLGCRCPDCTMAARMAQRAQNARRPDLNVASTLRYVDRVNPESQPRSRRLWTSAEMEVATARREDGKYLHTAAEAAQALGRSLQAVARIRQRCSSDAKYINMLGSMMTMGDNVWTTGVWSA